jgi:hypothetical protein
MQKRPHIEWVTAYSTQNLSEAYVVAGRLKKAGIAHFIKPDSVGHVYDLCADNRGGVEVFVNEGDYEQAAKILK